MPKIIFLPHEKYCPEGAVVEAEPGENICEVALRNGIEIAHAQPVMSLFAVGLIPLSHLMSWKTICWTRPGGLSLTLA